MKLIQKGQEGMPINFAKYTALSFPALVPGSADTNDNTDKDDKKSNGKKSDNIGLLTPSMLNILMEKGLPSDVKKFLDSVRIFDQSLQNPFLPTQSQDLSQYKYIIEGLNSITQSYEAYKNASELVDKSGGAQEIAITGNSVYVLDKDGTLGAKPVEQLTETDTPLTNSQLMLLRRDNIAGKDALLESAKNATSIPAIFEWVSKVINIAKEKSISSSSTIQIGEPGDTGTTKSYDARKIKAGINTIEQMFGDYIRNIDINTLRKEHKISSSVTDDQIIAQLKDNWFANMFMSPGSYTVKMENKTNGQNVAYALNALKAEMPANMKTLLKFKAKQMGVDPSRGLNYIISQLAAATVSDESVSDISFEPFKDTDAKKKKSTTEGDESGEQLSSPEAFVLGLGSYGYHQINIGGNEQFQMYGFKGSPMVDGKSAGYSLVGDLAKSNFSSVLDLSKATVGGARLTLPQMEMIGADISNVINVDLPIDRRDPYNSYKPDLEKLTQVEAVNQELYDKGLLLKLAEAKYKFKNAGIPVDSRLITTINNIYRQHNLDVALKPNGDLNLNSYRRFALVRADIPESVLPKNANQKYLKVLDGDENTQVQRQISTLNKAYSVNEKGMWGLTGDDVYEGTIFIPVDTSLTGATISSGRKVTTDEIMRNQALDESSEKVLKQSPNYFRH